MNMLNKYFYLFYEEQCDPMWNFDSASLQQKVHPLFTERKHRFSIGSCFVLVKVRKHNGWQGTLRWTSKLSFLPFQRIHAFIWKTLRIQSVNLSTRQSRICRKCVHQHTITFFMFWQFFHKTQSKTQFSLMQWTIPIYFDNVNCVCVPRLWREPCRGHASAMACQEAAQLRPAGCSCQSSERWGTTWRRSTTGRWK